jgi:hypothetical protein
MGAPKKAPGCPERGPGRDLKWTPGSSGRDQKGGAQGGSWKEPQREPGGREREVRKGEKKTESRMGAPKKALGALEWDLIGVLRKLGKESQRGPHGGPERDPKGNSVGPGKWKRRVKEDGIK